MKTNSNKGLTITIKIVLIVGISIMSLTSLLTPPSVLRMTFGGMAGGKRPIECMEEPHHYKLSLDTWLQKVKEKHVKIEFEKQSPYTSSPASQKGLFKHLRCEQIFLDISFEMQYDSTKKDIAINILEIYDGKPYTDVTTAYCDCIVKKFLHKM